MDFLNNITKFSFIYYYKTEFEWLKSHRTVWCKDLKYKVNVKTKNSNHSYEIFADNIKIAATEVRRKYSNHIGFDIIPLKL